MPVSEMIRIANAGGYWGDDLAQFKRQIELGPVDYVTLDFLAEITMSIMQKQRARDPRRGYARAITTAGGVTPLACRGALLEMAQRNATALEVAAVVGDDLMDRLGELNA